MGLLKDLAQKGKGTVNYIPDGSMVGTVFIHMLANLMTCLYRNVKISIPETGQQINCGFLQGGQTRDFIIPISAADFNIQVTTGNSTSVFRKQVLTSDTPVVEPGFHVALNRFKDGIKTAMLTMEAGAAAVDLAPLCSELTAINGGNMATQALLIDLADPSKYKGQIGKALASVDNFKRWGQHYLPGVLCGHANQWAINFKDEGSKLYGGETTKREITRGDTIFNTLPAPKASVAEESYANVRAASIAMGMMPPAPPAASRMPSLATVHYSAGPCFLGDGMVLMVDGNELRVDQIRKGHRVNGNHRVLCVIKTLVTHSNVVRLGDGTGCGFTEWHPVYIGGNWYHPNSLKNPTYMETDAIYNFVLESGHTMIINGIMTCTQGHEFEGPVIGHSYFGKRVAGQRHIIDDLMKSPGFDLGYVIWKNVRVFYDPDTMMINGMDAEYES